MSGEKKNKTKPELCTIVIAEVELEISRMGEMIPESQHLIHLPIMDCKAQNRFKRVKER